MRAAADAAVRDAGLAAALLRRRRPHQPGDRGRASSAPCDFFTLDVADCHRPAARTRRGRRLPGASPGARRPPRAARHRRAARRSTRDAARSGRGTLPRRRRRGRPHLPARRSPRRARARSSPRSRWTRPTRRRRRRSCCVILAAIADEGIPVQTIAPQVHRPLQQGRRLRRRRRRSSSASSTTTWR